MSGISSIAKPFSRLYSEPLPECRAWIASGVLPKNGIMLMGGLAKIGKSWLLMDAADCLATGRPLWGIEDFAVLETARVLYVEHEIGPWSMQERIHMKYNALKREPSPGLYLVSRQPSIVPTTELGLHNCVELIRSVDAQVVVFDPVGRMMANDVSSQEVGNFFSNLDRLLAAFVDTGLSIILSHHFTKPPRNDTEAEGFDALSAYNFRGSGRWRDAPDTLITLGRAGRPVPGELWRLDSRWEFRHGAERGDIRLALADDFSVRPASRTPRLQTPPKAEGSRRTDPELEDQLRRLIAPGKTLVESDL